MCQRTYFRDHRGENVESCNPFDGLLIAIKCGGAMERSRCPECGSVIGGSNHSLDASNARSDEFDRLSRMNANIGESPWANPY